MESVQRRAGICGSTLKILAITAMLMDHIGAVILEPLILQAGGKYRKMVFAGLNIWQWDNVLRLYIGRIAFPIFCFLLVEGFMQTSNVKKYAVRLMGFAVLSEVPFNLAFREAMFDRSYQNVFFTLFVGLIVMILVEQIEHAVAKGKCSNGSESMWYKVLWLIGVAGVLLAGMAIAELLCTDYGGYGVLCIVSLYLFREKRSVQLLAGTTTFIVGDILINGGTSELLAPLGFIPVSRYNGKRGLRMKYIFYLFYPVHLLVLCGIRAWIM